MYISLKRNNIVVDPIGLFYLPFINNLAYLDMSDQSHRDYNLFARKNRKVFNFHLSSVLVLSFNITLSILPHLDTLKLDFTNGRIFKHLNFTRRWVCFKNNVLTRFEVTYVKFQSVDGTIPCFNKLKHLDIRGLRTKVLDPYLLTEMPALETLLAGPAIPIGFFSRPNASILFHKNTKLKRLDLRKLNMRSVPLKALTPLQELQILNLSGNRLRTIRECHALHSLTSLDVTDNQLTYLPYSMLKHLEKNHDRIKDKHPFLNLTGNPLLCSCETIGILDDYYNSSIEISHLKDGLLTCVIHEATNVSQLCPVKNALQKLKAQCQKTHTVIIVCTCTVCQLQ